MRRASSLAIFGLLLAPLTAGAATIVLDFEGINPTYPSGYAFIQGFYNGGTSDAGTSGVNFGVEFTNNAQAICLNTAPSGRCSNTSRGGLGNPTSDKGGLFFLSGAETYMNVAAGFDTGFSFLYSAPNFSGSIGVYDGLSGTGNLLATLTLPTTVSSCDFGLYGAGFCPFYPIGVGFSGIAKSIAFAGVANQIVFDDVTFGSVIPDPPPAPEPSTMALIGLGLVGVAAKAWRRRRAS